MASLNIPYSFANNTVADATKVNDDFTAVKNFVEASVVQIDGSVQAGSGAIANSAVITAKIADGAVTSAKLAAGVIPASIVSSGTWTPTASYNGTGTAGGSWYKAGDIMTFYGWIVLTGTISAGNTITVSLPSGDYGSEAQSSIEVRWTGGIFGSGFYAGKVLVSSGGSMTPYYVAGGGFMTGFSTQYTGQSANSVVMTFNGVVRKIS